MDGHDNIYFGTGAGRLCCVNPDGTMRWTYRCIEGERSDLNGSPALGPSGVVIGGENGGVFFVPYDYPLTEAGRRDPRASEAITAVGAVDGAELRYMSRFGHIAERVPTIIEANQPITLVHSLKRNGRTRLSALDEDSLEVSGIGDARVVFSSNRTFMSLIPRETWVDPRGGELEIRVRCGVRTGLKRIGLKFFGGRVTDRVDRKITLKIAPREGKEAMPYVIPGTPGDPATCFRLSRIACPAPTLLPSYNQIGFDSLNYLAGIVEGSGSRALLWIVPGRFDEASDRVVTDPGLYDVYTMNLRYDAGLVTMANYSGFAITFFGSWDMPFTLFRLAFRVDTCTGEFLRSGDMNAVIRAGDIRFYGRFLKLLGISRGREGLMPVSGGIEGELWRPETVPDPGLAGEGRLQLSRKRALLTLKGSGLGKGKHVYGLLLVDKTEGRAVPVNYARKTTLLWNSDSTLKSITLDCSSCPLSGGYRAYLMADTAILLKLEGSI